MHHSDARLPEQSPKDALEVVVLQRAELHWGCSDCVMLKGGDARGDLVP